MPEVGNLNKVLPEPAPVERVEELTRRRESEKQTPFPAGLAARKKKRVPGGTVRSGGAPAGVQHPDGSHENDGGVGATIDTKA